MREREFDKVYYLNELKKIDAIIAKGNLANEKIQLLEEDKLFIFKALGEEPKEVEENITIDSALKKLEGKMRAEIKKLGANNIEYIYYIASFISRQRNEHQPVYTTNITDVNKVLNECVEFYGKLDHVFYGIITRLVNHPINLYNISENPEVIDECVWRNYSKLPVVNIYNTKSVLLYSKTVHEMQHQINHIINNNVYANYIGFNHLLNECSSIFSELIFCDKLKEQNPNLIDVNSLYIERISSIDSLSVNLMGYLQVMMLLDEADFHLDIDTFKELLYENFYCFDGHWTDYIIHYLDYNLYEKLKYLFSYLVALDIRTLYKDNPKDALKLLKYIIKLDLDTCDIESILKRKIDISSYKDGPYNHLQHSMEVDSMRLELNLLNNKRLTK